MPHFRCSAKLVLRQLQVVPCGRIELHTVTRDGGQLLLKGSNALHTPFRDHGQSNATKDIHVVTSVKHNLGIGGRKESRRAVHIKVMEHVRIAGYQGIDVIIDPKGAISAITFRNVIQKLRHHVNSRARIVYLAIRTLDAIGLLVELGCRTSLLVCDG